MSQEKAKTYSAEFRESAVKLAIHQNSVLPIKKQKGKPLSAEDKAHNKALSKQRVFIEHVNRRCKIFRIVKDVYRGKHKNYSLTWSLVAALVNLRYGNI
ncbi:transposase family protein [Methylovulum psychrotolerans]|uniref:transposase family protein n=1 Tax=Methylovulum psychrotolerans TaxID=1704499 RepID=UPI001E4CFCE2|nr:transposase family protein [Methylovulum psychrotolerans]